MGTPTATWCWAEGDVGGSGIAGEPGGRESAAMAYRTMPINGLVRRAALVALFPARYFAYLTEPGAPQDPDPAVLARKSRGD
jgi:hypothetical protein